MILKIKNAENIPDNKFVLGDYIKRLSLFYILKTITECSTVYTIIIAVQRIINALIPSIQVIIIASFINNVLMVAKKETPIEAIYVPLIGIIITLAYSIISEKLLYFIQIKLTNKIQQKIGIELLEKYGRLAYKHIEDTETSDLIARVFKTPEQQLINSYNNIINLISISITIISVIIIIITHVWWAGILIVVLSLPLFWLAIKSGRANYQVDRETTKYNRKYMYFGEILTGRDSVEERALFGYSEKFNNIWKENFEKARKILFRTEFKWFAKMKAGGVITSIVSLIVILALLPSVIAKVITIGMFISIINATNLLINRMTSELTTLMDNLARNMEFVADLRKFHKLEETEGAIDKPIEKKIKLESIKFINVGFKYPKTDRYILKNMSFTIESGKHYAFVGLNGAGKTTITKLITGLYQDFEGQILINDKSILEYSQQELKALCAVAYQDFAKYYISLRENLILGNVNLMNNSDFNILDSIKILELEELVSKLPKGVDTNLGKIRGDGVDLSGGQWQRIALARFIINPAPLRILDEPTSALDPISESNLYEKFEQLSKGQTTIFISHRLGSTKLADQIFVIDGGRVVESGGHGELMGCRGVYYQLYESQRSWYQ